MSQPEITITLKVTEGKTKDGRTYTACDITDSNGVRLARVFLKPTEFAYFAEVEGVYKQIAQ